MTATSPIVVERGGTTDRGGRSRSWHSMTRMWEGDRVGRILCRVVAWDRMPLNDQPGLALAGTDIPAFRIDIMLHPLGLDLAPHMAFVAGRLPASLYADWLDENGVAVPIAVTNLLRGW